MPDALFEIEVPHRFSEGWSLLLEAFLEFAIETSSFLLSASQESRNLSSRLRACSARMRAASLYQRRARLLPAHMREHDGKLRSTVSFDWQHGQVTSIGGADFFAMPLFYARKCSDEHGMR